MRISDDGRESQVDHVGEAGVQEVDGRDETSHIHWRTRVGDTVGCIPRQYSFLYTDTQGSLQLTRHVNEQLGKSTEGKWQRSPPE